MPIGEPHVYVNLLPNLKSNFATHMPQLDFRHWKEWLLMKLSLFSNTNFVCKGKQKRVN